MRVRSRVSSDPARLRREMVDRQLRSRDIADERVLRAMGAVPRELFVPEPLRRRAYDDAALPIGGGQTISQPYMVAKICEALALHGGERVLDVGTGSGYQAAVLAELAEGTLDGVALLVCSGVEGGWPAAFRPFGLAVGVLVGLARDTRGDTAAA